MLLTNGTIAMATANPEDKKKNGKISLALIFYLLITVIRKVNVSPGVIQRTFQYFSW